MSFLKSSSSISEAKSTLGLALVLATVLVVLVVGLFESNIKATAESQTFTALEESAASAENAANSQVRKYINALNFLHQTPPISGIVRATENENLDPKDGTTLEQWKQRLETIFVAFIENNEEVDQLRIIQANEDGSEFIRVERNGGSVLVVKDNDLQPKAARSYFIESVKRNKGEFYISDINLNREYGKLEFPYKSVIRLSLPIFSSSGERYGFIIMNVNAQFLLSQMEQTLVGNQLLFVTDSEGFFVSHPDSDKSFSRDLNPMVNWASEFESPSKIGRAKIKQAAQTNSPLYTVTRAFTINGNQQTAPFFLHTALSQSEVAALINEKRISVYSVIGVVTLIFVSVLLFVHRSNSKNIELAKVRGESVAIIAISKDAIFSVDSAGVVKSWNMAAESLFGIPSQLILNHHYSSFEQLSLLGLESVLTKGGKQSTFTTPYTDDEKEEHTLLITASTIWGEQSQFSGVAVVIRDVTDERKAKDAIERVNLKLEEKVVSRTKELVEATQEARKASSVKSSFISNISHEMRTPLNGVVGSLALLKRQPLNEKAEQLVSMMEISCNNLSVLINDVLDLSKIEAGKLDINNQYFDPLALIESIAKVFTVKAASKGLQLLVDTTGLPPVEINSDPHRINQILSNLLNNAIKFTEKGHIKLQASLSDVDAGTLQLHFSVCDTGVGIAQENQPKLFTAFTQADASVATQYGGTGLGLSICKQLSQLMGGDITFNSEVDIGSTFSFFVTLPETTYDSAFEHKMAVENESMLLNGITIGVSASYPPLEENICCLALHVGAEPQVLGKHSELGTVPWTQFNAIIVDEASSLIRELDDIWQAQAATKDAGTLPVVYILQKLEGTPFHFNHLVPLYLPKPLFRSSFAIVQQGLDAALSGYTLSQSDISSGKGKAEDISDDEGAADDTEQQLSIENANLLIVDDNMINREVAKGVLESLPVKLFTCSDGEEVVAFLTKCESKGRRIHSILMDCQMPNMNGYDATRAIREGKAGAMHKDVPIIAMTANAMLGEKEKCLEAGMDDFATKPVMADVLIPKVKQWLVHQITALASAELNDTDTRSGTGITASEPPLVDSLLSAISKEMDCDTLSHSRTEAQSSKESEVEIAPTIKNAKIANDIAAREGSEKEAEIDNVNQTQADENNSEGLDGCWEKDDAIARIMGDKALFSRVCDLYSRSAPDKLKLLQQAVDSRDFEKVQVLSLKLKGMSADIGAVQLQRDFESLWELSKAKKWEDAEALLPSITDDLNTFLEILEVA